MVKKKSKRPKTLKPKKKIKAIIKEAKDLLAEDIKKAKADSEDSAEIETEQNIDAKQEKQTKTTPGSAETEEK